MPWAAHGSSFTRPFEELVAWQAQRLDKSSIRRLLGINWRTVGTIIQRVVEERLSASRLEGPRIIGVDELAWSAGHKYVRAWEKISFLFLASSHALSIGLSSPYMVERMV